MTPLKILMIKHNLKRKDISTLLNISLRTVDAWLTNKKSGRTMSPQMMELLKMKIENQPKTITLTRPTSEELKSATEKTIKQFGEAIKNLAKK